ncbi:MAG: hypothetical protein QGG74_07205 [Phycisphaerales bacterium]|jgi:hypothetical protein|nr:hypothetical protein [Phycisphaerales bacterium]
MSNRKKRLERLVELAQVYRNWSRRELAHKLGRDASKLIPTSGNPKLDFIVELAEVLDWSVGDVTACLWGPADDTMCSGKKNHDTFQQLDARAKKAHARGNYHDMIRLAAKARVAATNPHDRALACNRELGGWDGLGRFTRSLDVAREGLAHSPVPDDVQRMLQSNLANACYSLWHLTEARTAASDLIDHFDRCPATGIRDRRTNAFARYVLGSTHRRLMDVDPDHATTHAATARSMFRGAIDAFSQGEPKERDRTAGIVRTCQGAILESEVMLGRLDPRQATSAVVDSMGEIVDLDVQPAGDLLESYGWWCIFGCNIAMRHISDERELHRLLALFTNKADEIADRLDNWAMRERVFSIQFDGHHRFVGWTGQTTPLTIDTDDIRMITGTMGRFPQFRETGWSMLESASVITDDIVAAS